MNSDLTVIGWIFRGLVGIAVGLIINYFSDVLPESRRLMEPRCQNCHRPLSWKSYFLHLNCTYCGNLERLRFFVVLILSVVASILLSFFPFANLRFWESIPLLLFFGVIVVIDIEHHLVLVETSLFGLVICLIYGTIFHGFFNSIIGAIGGLVITLAFFIFGIVFTKFVGRLRGKSVNTVAFGFGDVSAGTFLGLLTGWPGIVGAIIIALFSFGGFSVIYLLILILMKKYRSFTSALPFAPFLVLGVVILFYL